jgi:hypothetical protein
MIFLGVGAFLLGALLGWLWTFWYFRVELAMAEDRHDRVLDALIQEYVTSAEQFQAEIERVRQETSRRKALGRFG